MNKIHLNKKKGIISINTLDYFQNSSLKKIIKPNYRTLLSIVKNRLFGLTIDYTARLILVGVGFRVEKVTSDILQLKVGFSHFIDIKIPSTIKIFSTKRNQIVLQSSDLENLSKFASHIQNLKKPEVYKGKGILFVNQTLYLKEGKKK